MTSVDVIYARHLEPGDLFAGEVCPQAPTRPVQPFAAACTLTEVSTYSSDGVTWMRLEASHGLGLSPLKASQQVLVIRTK